MPKLKNFKKRFDKRPELLAPGEVCHGAFVVQKHGALSKMTAGAAFGAIGAIAASKIGNTEGAGQPDGGMAASFPLPDTTGLYLVVTDRRLAVFGQSALKGTPTECVGEVALGDVTGVDVEKRKMANTLLLHFRDGSAMQFDVPKMTKVDALAEVLAAGG